MRCPLADTHDFVESDDPVLGLVLVCVDCDAVLLPVDAVTSPVGSSPNYGLNDWEW